jgi:hypothetical protein
VAVCDGGAARGDEVRVRFVERVGAVDIVLPDNRLDYLASRRRVRVQVGVFDDAQGVAAAGGVLGWNDGLIDLVRFTGTRTPGRLAPFRAPDVGNGVPGADPFLNLTEIGATLGPQTLVWGCNGVQALPMPVPVVRGRNTFVSVYEVTIEPAAWCATGEYEMHVGGYVVTAASWQVVGKPHPPACPDIFGEVTYSPVGEVQRPFQATLQMIVGAPGIPPPACPPDWTRDGVLNSQDFFEFLGDFFGGVGDYTCDGVVNSADLFAYLADFFTGC